MLIHRCAYDKGYEDGYGDAEVDFSGQQDSYTTTYRKWYRPRSIHYSTFYYGYNSPWSQNIWSPWGYSRGFNHQNSYMSWPYYPYNNGHSNYGYHFGYGYNYGNNFRLQRMQQLRLQRIQQLRLQRIQQLRLQRIQQLRLQRIQQLRLQQLGLVWLKFKQA